MAILVFFRYFFCIFGAPPWVGGFVFFRNFFRILGFQRFLGSLPGPRDRKGRRFSSVPNFEANFCLNMQEGQRKET